MIKIEKLPNFEDPRGSITDLIEEHINSVSKVTFTSGAVRGNHVHRQTTQWTYVLYGSLTVYTEEDGKIISKEFREGDFFVSLPNSPHAMKALEGAEILVFTQGPRAGSEYESDTFPHKLIE
jgi:quercetin dioxygenase-like cupin family protein